MIIGVPKEIKTQEHRVGLLPSAVYLLARQGHQVVVERGAGVDAGYPDNDYATAGAKLVDSHEEAFRADLIVKGAYTQSRLRQMIGITDQLNPRTIAFSGSSTVRLKCGEISGRQPSITVRR